jgi:tetratricopeptide (TPR) repeat protein
VVSGQWSVVSGQILATGTAKFHHARLLGGMMREPCLASFRTLRHIDRRFSSVLASERTLSMSRVMRQITTAGLVAIFLPAFVCARVRGHDLPGGMTMTMFIRPSTSRVKCDRATAYVQKTPDFSLRNGDTKITPGCMGFICQLERTSGDQSLFWVRSESLRGWAPTYELVPLNHAEAFFSKKIKVNPRDAFAFLMRGVVRCENDDVDRALADVNEAIRLDSGNASAWIKRGYLRQRKERVDRAVADVEQAIKIDPTNSYAYLVRGVFHCAMNALDKAMSDIDQAARLGSRAAMLNLTRGMIYVQRRELEPAIAAFDRTLQIDPKYVDAWLMLGMVYMLQSDGRKALAAFNRAIAADPQYAEAFEMRAVNSISHRKYRDARRDLNEAIRLEPEAAGHLSLRARLCFEMEDYKQSLADLESVLRLEPKNGEAHRNLAWFLAYCPDDKLRDTNRAMNLATRSCELTEWKRPSSLATLAAVDSENGDFDGAVRWQRKAIDLLVANDPKQEEYNRLLKRFQARKPSRRLGLFEEIGLSIHGAFAKNGEADGRN